MLTDEEIFAIADDNDSGRAMSGRRIFSERNLLLFARALLARQPAAIDEQCERGPCQIDNFSSRVCEFGTRSCVAEHAAPSAEQDERGDDLEPAAYLVRGVDGYNEEYASVWIKRANADAAAAAIFRASITPLEERLSTASTSANVAQGAEMHICGECDRQFRAAPPAQTALADQLQAEVERLNSIINTPHADDFLRAVSIEAEHQRQRWGTEGDAGKTPADWFWLVGYLGGKALHAHAANNTEKAEHHIITTAAALANWHRNMFGKTDMRPGIDGDAALTAAQSASGDKS